jgi:hypothetical protein
MSEIAICSIVRDGMGYLPAYRRQLENLNLRDGDSWRLYILEGDSTDGTFDFLKQWEATDPRIKVGRECVGEALDKDNRAARLAQAANACINLIPNGSSHTHVLWLEADLCFPPELVTRLLAKDVDIIAPIIYLGGYFYDTWGFRDLKGKKWKSPASSNRNFKPFRLIEMSSVGSCVMFRRAIWDSGIRFRGTYDDGLLVGVCQDARRKGNRVWADTSTAILHPSDVWEKQMWQPSAVQGVSSGGEVWNLSTSEAQEAGLQRNLPVVDPGFILQAQSSLWKTFFKRYNTSCLRHRASMLAALRSLVEAAGKAGLYKRREYERLKAIFEPAVKAYNEQVENGSNLSDHTKG